MKHFVCAKCEKPFYGNRHYEKKGLAYCEIHYHQLFGNLCFVCNQVIGGDGKWLVSMSWYCCVFNASILLFSVHCSEQGLVCTSFCLLGVRYEDVAENQILRIRFEASLQEVLRQVPCWAEETSEESIWSQPKEEHHYKLDGWKPCLIFSLP